MKKIILIFTILCSTLGFCKVNIEEVFNNATLNIDYSSSMIFNEKQLVQEKEIAEWILSNPNRFENVNQIKIAFETKWYWGSWKKVVRALEFVKKENVQNRIAYFEDLRRRNEAECRRQQQRKELLTTLAIDGAKLAGITIWENRHEIANFVKENWNSRSSNYSNENINSSSSNDNGEEKDSEDKKTLENKSDDKVDIEFRETDQTGICNYHVDKPKIRYFNAVNKNNEESKGTFKIIACDGKYWESCPDGLLVGNIEISKTTIKDYLIRQYESGRSNADSYTLIEK